MAQPVLKSIHPVNLLSFGPKTEPIELRSLNILIGANGSGKSNLIEVIRLLQWLPERDPWSVVLTTGGVAEWIWKGNSKLGEPQELCSLVADLSFAGADSKRVGGDSELVRVAIGLTVVSSTFRFRREEVYTFDASDEIRSGLFSRYERVGPLGKCYLRSAEPPVEFELQPERSIFSQLSSQQVGKSGVNGALPELFAVAELFEKFYFFQDWQFGNGCVARTLQDVGRPIDRLMAGGYNLAQMLKYFQDFHRSVFEQIEELTRRFYEPTLKIEIQLLGTYLQIAIAEEGGHSTPAPRLSDGMLRWLSLLCVLLNPTPAPVTCIDEPELGLHPDVIPTLADLLRDAATRTQLIVTTHSTALVDAFSDEPEAICVCEKIEGSTVIQRLSKPDLQDWLKDYSLGSLWMRGFIGGNRW